MRHVYIDKAKLRNALIQQKYVHHTLVENGNWTILD